MTFPAADSSIGNLGPRAERAIAGQPPPSRLILGMRVDATTYDDAAGRILEWARRGSPRYVCVAAVNNVMHAHDDSGFLSVMNGADLVTPDGMPLVWGLRRLGIPWASRVYGPELMEAILDRVAIADVPIGFYGGTPEVLNELVREVRGRWPSVEVRYAFSPPFRSLDETEERAIVEAIAESGVRILFVGLGCPKQELWMARHRESANAVLVGVGAAFDFLAGKKPQAPRVIRQAGLEWLFRLITEPRRLWKRYLTQNPRFAALFVRQLVASRRRGDDMTTDEAERGRLA